jgi:hypothetical protein
MRRGEDPGHVNLAQIKEFLGYTNYPFLSPYPTSVLYDDQLASVWHHTYNSAARQQVINTLNRTPWTPSYMKIYRKGLTRS